MTTSPVEKSMVKKIERLVQSGRREVQSITGYIEELRKEAVEAIDEEDVRKKSAFFKALSDPTRIRMLELLHRRGELCVCEIMAALNLTQPTTSHHLGILEKAGLVRGRKEGRWMFYSLLDEELWKRLSNLAK